MPGQQMTREQVAAMFPRASRSTIEANSGFAFQDQIVEPKEVAKVNALRSRREPNKTEAEFSRILKAQYPDSEILYESIKLRLADGCWYTPDFARLVGHGMGIYFYEVKGAHIWDDAKVKFKVAAEQYPQFVWEMHQKKAGAWARIL